MRYEDVAQPEPAAREVLIKADAIGVNCVDIMRRSVGIVKLIRVLVKRRRSE
jgi:NADPH:quinone reductase-like Zn-dependent oxidoreductase